MTLTHQWEKIEPRPILPGFTGRFLHSENMTFVLWEIEAGAALPEHAHPNEQTAHILEGEFELVIEGQKQTVYPGSVVVIPSNIPHSGRALTYCRIMDVFYPLRQDYLPGATSNLFSASST